MLKARACAGTFLTVRDPVAVGVLARAGFDFLLMDTEHFPIGPGEALNLVNAARAFGIRIVIRIAEINRGTIQQALAELRELIGES